MCRIRVLTRYEVIVFCALAALTTSLTLLLSFGFQGTAIA